jgi:phosphoribosylformylglycinamidine cyclo-ligase
MSNSTSYGQAGVNLDAAQQAKRMIVESVRSTYGPEVLGGIGAFGGMFSAAALKAMEEPILVASTDGVGTKTKIAAHINRWDTIGQDLVNHCVNDILAQGARPLFVMDYVATAKLDSQQIAEIVSGIAAACRQTGCALLGGETAQMPGVYVEGEIDIAGTIVGVVDRSQIITGERVQAGDAIIALPSNGLHTNGYSLARSALAKLDWTVEHPALGTTPAEALLIPHRSYFEHVMTLRNNGVDLRGIAHITGGGLYENLPRAFSEGLGARIKRGTWPEPAIFGLIQSEANVETREMFEVFNMGLGMLVIIPQEQVAQALGLLEGDAFLVGEITNDGEVTLIAAE